MEMTGASFDLEHLNAASSPSKSFPSVTVTGNIQDGVGSISGSFDVQKAESPTDP